MADFLSINKIINLDYLGKSNISISTAVLIFYLCIAGNFTNQLFSKDLQTFIQNNRYVQHIFGLVTMMVTIMTFANIKNPIPAIIYSICAYVFFLLTTKMSANMNIAIIILLVLGFLAENMLKDKEEKLEEDENVPYKVKDNYKKARQIKVIIMFIVVAIIMAYGVYNYATTEYLGTGVQYGGGLGNDSFDPIKFMLD